MEGFRAIFQGVEDPRKSNATKHDLNEMLAIALLATLAGKSSCSSFARYAEFNCEFLSEFMELKGGPPCHDSFSDLFNGLDPKQLAAALTTFAKTLLAALPSDQAAIDGKVLKNAIMDASKKSSLHLVQADSHRTRPRRSPASWRSWIWPGARRRPTRCTRDARCRRRSWRRAGTTSCR